jgi:hypothetical protein
MKARIIDEPLQGPTLSRPRRQEKETMRLDGSHSGRFDNFGQFYLFKPNSSCRGKKIADPNGYNGYCAEIDF